MLYTSAMSKLTGQLHVAQQKAMTNRPKVGGFPYLAEVLRQAGVTKNVWSLPACQSIYWINGGQVAQTHPPLVNQSTEIPDYNESSLIAAIRADQAGETTFTDFLQAIWDAGVIWYQVDFGQRLVIYGSADGQTYTESYSEVTV